MVKDFLKTICSRPYNGLFGQNILQTKETKYIYVHVGYKNYILKYSKQSYIHEFSISIYGTL